MEEKRNSDSMKLLSTMMGAEGADTLGMMERMERLRRLMGNNETAKNQEVPEGGTGAPVSPFGTTTGENILSAAIPFLDQEYQRDIFVVVRLMEMRRVMENTKIEAREKQEEPVFRRHKMLGAVKNYLPKDEGSRLERMLRLMEMKDVLEKKEGR